MRAALLAAVVSLTAGAAFAQNSPWAASISLGTDNPVGGTLHNGVTVNNAILNFQTGTLRLRERTYGDIYEGGFTGSVEIRYRMSEASEIFGAFTWANNSGGTGQIGEFQVGNTLTPVLGAFSDYKSIGVEVGYRQYFYTFLEGLQPYVAVRGGVTRVDPIAMSLAVGQVRLNNLEIYDESYAFTIGGDVGLTYQVASWVTLGGEVGLRYTTKLKDNDAILRNQNLAGLATINDDGSKLSVPVQFRLNANF